MMYKSHIHVEEQHIVDGEAQHNAASLPQEYMLQRTLEAISNLVEDVYLRLAFPPEIDGFSVSTQL